MTKPNILILHADQHRQDCIGAYGNPDVQTPHIDALARDGMLYRQHYTVYPVCTPSRYSLFSGQYVHQHQAWSNRSTLPNGTATFPKLLREAGYRTRAVGKMHMTPVYQDIGFEQMALAEQNGEGRFEDDYHQWLTGQDMCDELDLADQVDWIRETMGPTYFERFGAFESDLDADHHSTGWVTEQAKANLRDWNPDGGNLLFVGYVKPHHPFDPPAPYSTMYDPDSLTLLPGYTGDVPAHDYANSSGFFDHKTLTEERLRRVMANYYGAITQIDDGVGQLLAQLKAQGCYDNTLIVYTSDHGEYLGYHHMLLKSNFLYDPLAKIPLIVKYPAGQAQTGCSDMLCENIDLAATILHCCGLSPASSMSGKDLRDTGCAREYVFSEGQYGSDEAPCHGYMIRSARYKLLVHGSFEQVYFYDLLHDPHELRNAAEDPDYQEALAQHQQELITHMLFRCGGKNHCDEASPQLQNPAELARRSAVATELVKSRMDAISRKFS